MKIYRKHNCADRHTSWPSLAACIWPRATITGDGPFASTTCGARVVTLYEAQRQAEARKASLDCDSCRPGCHQHHYVVTIAHVHENTKPPKPASAATRRATTPAAPPPPKPEKSICGRPRTNGQPCHRPSGWGADPGERHCRDHGGSITERTAEKERLVEQALVFVRLAEKARGTLLTPEEQQQAEAAARDVLGARTGRRGASEAAVSALAGWPPGSPCLEVPDLAWRPLGFLFAELLRRPAGEVS